MVDATQPYYTNINLHLLNLCPAAERVMEFGCGAGAFMAAYKEKFPSCHAVGVEMVGEVATAAEKIFEQVICGNAEQLDLTAHGCERESFDLLLYGDVLEHFSDPWTALRNHMTYLKPGGAICICIPNVGHCSVLLGLLRGQFEYADAGLLDRTHLRFFTRGSFTKLLTDCGLQIEHIGGRILNKEGMRNTCDRIANILGGTIDAVPAELQREWHTYQYLALARKPIK